MDQRGDIKWQDTETRGLCQSDCVLAVKRHLTFLIQHWEQFLRHQYQFCWWILESIHDIWDKSGEDALWFICRFVILYCWKWKKPLFQKRQSMFKNLIKSNCLWPSTSWYTMMNGSRQTYPLYTLKICWNVSAKNITLVLRKQTQS